MQLVAYGAQDANLTGKPTITFWKSVYRRYTNFSLESIAQTFIGSAGFGKKVTCSLSRNGDLVSSCLLEVQLPGLKGADVTGGVYGVVSHKSRRVNLFQETEFKRNGKTYTRQVGDEAGTLFSILRSVSAGVNGRVAREPNPNWNTAIFNHLKNDLGMNFFVAVDKSVAADDTVEKDSTNSILVIDNVGLTQLLTTFDDIETETFDALVMMEDLKLSSNVMNRSSGVVRIPMVSGKTRVNFDESEFDTFFHLTSDGKQREVFFDVEDRCFRHGVAWVKKLGHYLIDKVEVDIGGQRIDSHTGEWLNIMSELTMPAGKIGSREGSGTGYSRMIGDTEDMTKVRGVVPPTTLYVPLRFWFNQIDTPGLALPLLALQYHEVKVSFLFAQLNALVVGEDNNGTYRSLGRGDFTQVDPERFNTSLYVDYVYLDNEERRRMAQESHEYLIPQVQFTGEETVPSNSGTERFRLNFNHPVRELVFVGHSVDEPQPSEYTVAGKNPFARAKLMLNGHDRFSERGGDYFDCCQPFFHHTRCPSRGVCSYSFALRPEQHQPSGTCNMSRIDNAQLELNMVKEAKAPAVNVRVYAVNYNTLRIMSGLGGMAFSN